MVIGDTGRTAVSGALLGSVAMVVMQRSSCSVAGRLALGPQLATDVHRRDRTTSPSRPLITSRTGTTGDHSVEKPSRPADHTRPKHTEPNNKIN